MTLPTDSECIFCKIVAGNIPSFKVYEDDHTLAFMDIFPAVSGHTLVIHKGHYETLFDMPEEAVAAVATSVRRVAEAVKSTLSPDGVNILQNNYPAAGQTVPHYHVHILPRTPGDGLMVKWPMKEGDKALLAEQAEKVKSLLA